MVNRTRVVQPNKVIWNGSLQIEDTFSCSIQGLSYTRVVLSPYIYLSSFSFSWCIFFLPLSPFPSVHSRYLYLFGENYHLYHSSKFLFAIYFLCPLKYLLFLSLLDLFYLFPPGCWSIYILWLSLLFVPRHSGRQWSSRQHSKDKEVTASSSGICVTWVRPVHQVRQSSALQWIQRVMLLIILLMILYLIYHHCSLCIHL